MRIAAPSVRQNMPVVKGTVAPSTKFSHADVTTSVLFLRLHCRPRHSLHHHQQIKLAVWGLAGAVSLATRIAVMMIVQLNILDLRKVTGSV